MSNEESPESAPHDDAASAAAPPAPATSRHKSAPAPVIAADAPRPVVIEPMTPSRSFWAVSAHS
jgi:hypothetical protein